MKNKSLILLILPIISCLSQFCYLGDNVIYAEQKKYKKLNNIRDKINNNFEKINTFIADINIRRANGENIVGKMLYKSKPYMRLKSLWEYSDGNKAVIFDNKDSQIIYLPSENIAIKKVLSVEQSFDSRAILFYKIEDYKSKAYDDNDFYYYAVELPVPPPKLMTDEIPMIIKGVINKKYGYTEKIIFLNRNNVELEIQEFKNYRLNVSLDDKEFEFIPPKDCNIMLQEETNPRDKNSDLY